MNDWIRRLFMLTVVSFILNMNANSVVIEGVGVFVARVDEDGRFCSYSSVLSLSVGKSVRINFSGADLDCEKALHQLRSTIKEVVPKLIEAELGMIDALRVEFPGYYQRVLGRALSGGAEAALSEMNLNEINIYSDGGFGFWYATPPVCEGLDLNVEFDSSGRLSFFKLDG